MIDTTIQSIKKYWRVYILVIVSLISIVLLFNPVIPGIELGEQDANQENQTLTEKYTGLQFGIELGGGTRIQAPVDSITAENTTLDNQDIGETEQNIADKLENTDSTDVIVRDNTIEITSGNETVETVQQALDALSISYEDIQNRSTEQTRDEIIETLQTRIDTAGLSGGDVREVEMQDGTYMVLIEVPDLNREETVDLVTTRGNLQIDIYYYNNEIEEYTTEEAVLETDDFRSIGTPQQGDETTSPHVPVTLESSSASEFANKTIETGVAQQGGTVCQYEQAPESTDPCLLTVVDDEVIYSAGMSGSLASDIRSGEWEESGSFILQTESFNEAQQLSINLQSGGLPAPIDVEQGEINFISSQQGDQFRMIAFIIGILSIIVVSLVVSLRYNNIKLAGPMMITAAAEVLIILAIASVLDYPIDIAVIAGFIAVIGTGVDDLIIIADRIMRKGIDKSSSSRVFQKRFRKALWIILTAAGTTIIALGPLAILDLRQLQGFAIFTIIGIIIGVLVTRPAFGDMLRYFFSKKR